MNIYQYNNNQNIKNKICRVGGMENKNWMKSSLQFLQKLRIIKTNKISSVNLEWSRFKYSQVSEERFTKKPSP
jgi:hypothetical protein